MGISVTKPTQKKALVPFQIRCYLSASSVVATLLTSFCDKITTFLTRMILERFCCILTLVHAQSMASFQTIVHRASHTSHMFVMLLFPTLTTISMSFALYSDVFSLLHKCCRYDINPKLDLHVPPVLTKLHHFLHNNNGGFPHSLSGCAVISWQLFSKFYPFHMHPPFLFFLDSKHFLRTNGTQEK